MFWKIFIPICLITAALLRGVWVGDMQWKLDEKYLFQRSTHIGITEPWPVRGQQSGVNLRNPPFSLWVWAGMAKAFRVETPEDLARCVQIFAVLAIVGFFALAQWMVPPGREREAWRWAAALGSVAFLSVTLQKRIWVQCLFPPMCLLFWMAWLKRQTAWGAFFFGLIGMLMGQLHMSGFFLFAGVCLWQIFRAPLQIKIAGWYAGIVGVLAGYFVMYPWIQYAVAYFAWRSGAEKPPYRFSEVLLARFYRNWFDDGMGIGLDYSLGLYGGHFQKFMSEMPVMGALRWLVTGIGAAILAFALKGWVQQWKKKEPQSETGFALSAVLWGCGLVFTFSGLTIHRHYMTAFFPFEALSFAWLALNYVPKPRWVLGTLWLSQLAITSCFLIWIHQNCGAPLGDYGVSYRCQAPSDQNPVYEQDRDTF